MSVWELKGINELQRKGKTLWEHDKIGGDSCHSKVIGKTLSNRARRYKIIIKVHTNFGRNIYKLDSFKV